MIQFFWNELVLSVDIVIVHTFEENSLFFRNVPIADGIPVPRATPKDWDAPGEYLLKVAYLRKGLAKYSLHPFISSIFPNIL